MCASPISHHASGVPCHYMLLPGNTGIKLASDGTVGSGRLRNLGASELTDNQGERRVATTGQGQGRIAIASKSQGRRVGEREDRVVVLGQWPKGRDRQPPSVLRPSNAR